MAESPRRCACLLRRRLIGQTVSTIYLPSLSEHELGPIQETTVRRRSAAERPQLWLFVCVFVERSWVLRRVSCAVRNSRHLAMQGARYACAACM